MKRELVALTFISLFLGLTACGGRVDGYQAELYGIEDATQIRWDLLAITFPVVGKSHFRNDWHDPRSGNRQHLGTDIIAKKMVPVVAAASGTVAWVHGKKGKDCCSVGITHESQGLNYESRYRHLNNDTPGTDDGKGVGVVKKIKKGVHVEAGELIGWVGDSGNAENTTAHLHFELYNELGNPINPYLLLERASKIERPVQ
jgi:murein DD-endopeptidase MepM/ murein hydrolase activator NlpD